MEGKENTKSRWSEGNIYMPNKSIRVSGFISWSSLTLGRSMDLKVPLSLFVFVRCGCIHRASIKRWLLPIIQTSMSPVPTFHGNMSASERLMAAIVSSGSTHALSTPPPPPPPPQLESFNSRILRGMFVLVIKQGGQYASKATKETRRRQPAFLFDSLVGVRVGDASMLYILLG